MVKCVPYKNVLLVRFQNSLLKQSICLNLVGLVKVQVLVMILVIVLNVLILKVIRIGKKIVLRNMKIG